MSRVKRRVTHGILICTMLFTIAAVSIPAVAVNSGTATNGEEPQEDSGKVSGIELENSQELPIIYEQQEENAASETNISAPEAVDHSWNGLYLLLIPIIIALVFVAFYFKKLKKKEEVKQ